MSRFTLSFAVVTLLLAGPVSASGVLWQTAAVPVPAPPGNSSLGVGNQPAVVHPDGSIDVVFQSFVPPDTFWTAYNHRTADGTWGEPQIISSKDRLARNPCLALDHRGALHVFWEDFTDPGGNIVHRERLADGTWLPADTVSPAEGVSRDPVAAVDAFNRVHVVWVDGRTGKREIMQAVLTPGQGWSDGEIVSPNSDGPDEPCVAADSLGAVHVVWRDRDPTVTNGYSFQIIYVRLGPESSEPHPVRLVDQVSVSQSPFIMAAPDGTLHLVWSDDRLSKIGTRSGFFDIYYKRYLPGVGWGHDKQFTWQGTNHAHPVEALGVGNTVNVVWEDYRFGNPEVYYRQITPETGWDPEPSRLTADPGASRSPAVVGVPGGGVLLLWSDARASGEYTLFARTGIPGP
jgi:hypothetical protein